jgi:NAD(P)-dependent dehydrogenase (short-subunit alcohol dehydrogenase family)
MFSLAGKSVLVTGGSKGNGRGIASMFATADANVAVGARSRSAIDSAVAALDGLGSGKVIGVAVGLSRRADRVRPGRIVLTSSITGPITGFPGWSHYGASKAAQLGFMRTAGSNSPRTGSPSTG